MKRLAPAIALVAAVMLVLSGCVSWFRPPASTGTQVSTPAAEDVSPELQPFYQQVVSWSSCSGGFQCATVTAPMDWSDPAKASIKLALIRHQATGHRIGSLLVNPGGPGASGVEFVRDSLDYAVDPTLEQNFDVVGFDPRGVGDSSAVSCYSNPDDLTHYLYDIAPGERGSDQWIAEVEKSNADFGQACLKYTGPLLQYVDNVSAARDLDLLRAVLGDSQLYYLGYSYGTLLGATYADLYPGKVGRLVLDGALDPASASYDVTKVQAVGFENNLKAYLADCLKQSDCPFAGDTVDEAEQSIAGLQEKLETSPLTGSDGRKLGGGTMDTAIVLPLYSQDNWPYLTQLFQSVAKGQADLALRLADSYNSRNDDGTYSDNTMEAFIAYNCLDYPATSDDPDEMRQQEAELAQLAPVFGPYMAFGGASCGKYWPFQTDIQPAPVHADGAAPIIVVGTTNDPATPYQWAQNLASELSSGHLVTYHGNGHTAYNKGNSCVDDTVDNYLVKGTVPASDPGC